MLGQFDVLARFLSLFYHSASVRREPSDYLQDTYSITSIVQKNQLTGISSTFIRLLKTILVSTIPVQYSYNSIYIPHQQPALICTDRFRQWLLKWLTEIFFSTQGFLCKLHIGFVCCCKAHCTALQHSLHLHLIYIHTGLRSTDIHELH